MFLFKQIEITFVFLYHKFIFKLGINATISTISNVEEDLETEVSQAKCIQQGQRIVGKHIYGNLYGCDTTAISDENSLKNIIIEAAKIAKMTIWDTKVWKFGGEKGGLSALALILESHIAIHTWGELNYCTVDVFTCGDKSAPNLAFEYISSKLKPKSIAMHTANRSS